MKLEGTKLLKETPTEFHVEHPEHGLLRIAKEHLHHGTVSKIQQHFAEGGEVEPSPTVEELEANLPSYGQAPTDLPSNPLEALTTALMPAPTPPTAAAPQPPPPAPPPPQPQAPNPIPGPSPMPRASAEFNQGVKQEIGGIEGQGQAAQQQATQEAAAYQQRQEGLQKMQADFEGQMQAHQARVQSLESDILSGKIDPNRFWNTRSTGQKVTAALGMILGGLGSAAAGQPNYAVQAIDKAIDRDIESQKLDLGKKETMLGHYMQQGHQLMTAHQMVKADYMDMTASQILQAASKGAGQKAMAVAQAAAGHAHIEADQMRRQATLQNLQIQQTKLGTDFQQAQMGAMRQLMQSQGGASGGGSSLDPRAEALLPEEMRGRVVRLADGSATLARTSKDAEEVKKTQEATALLRDKLQRYSALLEAHKHGVSSVLSPNDYATAQSLHESILTDLNGLAGLNRFTHEEAQIFAGRIPDITSKQIFRGHQAKLKELGKEIDDKVWETNKTHLSLPQRRRPSG